jgi:type II secretory pathway pseudopilin PulG
MMIAVLKGMKRLFSRDSGYTLLEIAAVVAVTGTLALVAIPIVQNKLEAGKVVAATEGLKQVCAAVSDYYGDVGMWPNTLDDDPSDGTDLAQIIRTDNDLNAALETGNLKGWDSAGAGTPTIIPSRDVLTNNVAGRANWKGPYLAKEELEDPWGNPYYVTVEADVSGAQKAVFGVCAGADGQLDITRVQPYDDFDISTVDDDYVIRIR